MADDGLHFFLVRRVAAVAVGHQFGAKEKALAPHVANHFVLVLECTQLVQHVVAHRNGVPEQVFVLDDPHVFQRRRRTCRTATKGGNVTEIVQVIACVVLEQVKNGFGCGKARDRGIA